LTIAMIIPITTTTTIAACSQSQVGDMRPEPTPAAAGPASARSAAA
jgi:hypothetical protein